MAGRDPIGVQAFTEALGSFVARIPGGGLNVPTCEARPLDMEVDPQHCAEIAALALVAIRGLTQAVVEVQRLHSGGCARPSERGPQAGRVRAARNHCDSG